MSLARLNVYWTVSQARERPKTFTPVELSVSLILFTFYLLSVPFNNSKKIAENSGAFAPTAMGLSGWSCRGEYGARASRYGKVA